jgi:Flp pilus assembly pilin Flp
MRPQTFSRDERGVSALEYGTILSLILLAIAGTTTNVGIALVATFATLGNALLAMLFGPT